MTQARRAWKTRVPMGGTLHRDISNTRRSLSTTRQENGERREQPVEYRATTAVLRVGDIKATKIFLSYDPLDPEHEAIGRVPWVNSTKCTNILLSTRGLRPLSHTK
jgi:hypothetical protein